MAKCKRRFLFGANHKCARPAGHLGLHRNTVKVRQFETVQWGDNECEKEQNNG